MAQTLNICLEIMQSIIYNSGNGCFVGTERGSAIWQDDTSVSGASFMEFMPLYFDKKVYDIESKGTDSIPCQCSAFWFTMLFYFPTKQLTYHIWVSNSGPCESM